jgi:hypothetical protein
MISTSRKRHNLRKKINQVMDKYDLNRKDAIAQYLKNRPKRVNHDIN